MCGRYALALRPSEVRQQLEHANMPVDDAPEDDSVRQSYNFAPGYHGLVYRADGQEFGSRPAGSEEGQNSPGDGEVTKDKASTEEHEDPKANTATNTKYKLQSMKWGLIPFWTVRNPDYGSVMKTINCRDDSLAENRGMWTSMKKKKRCIVVAQGFYEWLKKNNGREKIPHFTKRKDGQLMCFAGLWDCVQYEDSDEKTYTYTIITTDSNKQLNFLHDRMPVILENGSEAIRTWLDPQRTEWSRELQSLLKPYEGELECYPVSKDVGKVGNNSPSFVIPVYSAENKNNIANFFGAQRKAAKAKAEEEAVDKTERDVEDSKTAEGKMQRGVDEPCTTTNRVEGTENNAPLPITATVPSAVVEGSQGVKREHGEGEDEGDTADGARRQKRRIADSPAAKQSPTKKQQTKKTRSATSNNNNNKSKGTTGRGDRKITSFFGK